METGKEPIRNPETQGGLEEQLPSWGSWMCAWAAWWSWMDSRDLRGRVERGRRGLDVTCTCVGETSEALLLILSCRRLSVS